MGSAEALEGGSLAAVQGRLAAAKRRNDWQAIVALEPALPAELDAAAVGLADELSFAHGQLGHTARAVELLERAFALAPTHRRASGLAYLFYAASMDLAVGRPRRGGRRGGRDADGRRDRGPDEPGGAPRGGDKGAPPYVGERERLRKGFRRWIAEALRLEPRSVKDLYRLGLYEAQVESFHDKVALRAFCAAIESHRELEPAERERRHDLRKYYLRALYAGGRSALRLGQLPLARRLAFTCVREDAKTDYVEPVFKLGLAGKVCTATGELDHAERALRLALDAKGPPRRDYLYGLLAEVERRRRRFTEGCRWIEIHVPTERRSAALWRSLGDLRADGADASGALAAWRSALLRDRTGRHLTLTRLGHAQAALGDRAGAERSFREAIDFKRRRYSAEHPEAVTALAALLAARGKTDEAQAMTHRISAGAASSARDGQRTSERAREGNAPPITKARRRVVVGESHAVAGAATGTHDADGAPALQATAVRPEPGGEP